MPTQHSMIKPLRCWELCLPSGTNTGLLFPCTFACLYPFIISSLWMGGMNKVMSGSIFIHYIAQWSFCTQLRLTELIIKRAIQFQYKFQPWNHNQFCTCLVWNHKHFYTCLVLSETEVNRAVYVKSNKPVYELAESGPQFSTVWVFPLLKVSVIKTATLWVVTLRANINNLARID